MTSNGMICITAAITVPGTGDGSGGHNGRANVGVGGSGSVDEIDFFDRQLAGPCTCQYAIVVTHAVLLPYFWDCLRKPKFIQLKAGQSECKAT
jgi:hypothetical protein